MLLFLTTNMAAVTSLANQQCEHVLTAVKLSSTKRFDSIQDVWDSIQSRSKFTKASTKSNSSRLTEELHERFSKATIDGTSSMFIFNALVLSLTRPNFFSRAIIEPGVQAPLPAPPGLQIVKCYVTKSTSLRYKCHSYSTISN